MSQRSHTLPRVEICGGIASGKTSLAALLPQLGVRVSYEDFSSNPFFSSFYVDPRAYAFETEITFLLQHFSAIKRAQRISNQLTAFDFSMALDAAYACVTLPTEDQAVFDAVLNAAIARVGTSDLLIRLRCDPDEELHRIASRGRAQEQSVTRVYLEQLDAALDSALRAAPFSMLRMLELDSHRINFVGDKAGVRHVLDLISGELSRLESNSSVPEPGSE